jgi:hypothetical protein
MDKPTQVANPFALMLNPDEVLAAMERSERLGLLQRRICKPLDKPMIPHETGEAVTSDDDLDVTQDPES